MSARKSVCQNTLAFVLLDIQTVSSIGINDTYLGSQARALALRCLCDVCTLIRKLNALSREDRNYDHGAFLEYFGRLYKAKVYSTVRRDFRFRCSRFLSREVEARVDFMLGNHLTDCQVRRRIAGYSQRQGL